MKSLGRVNFFLALMTVALNLWVARQCQILERLREVVSMPLKNGL